MAKWSHMKYAFVLAIWVYSASAQTCSPGEWSLESVCVKCHPSCSLCADPFSCELCAPCYTQPADPHSLCSSTKCPDSEACVCAQGCFALPSGICTICHSTCLRCSGPTAHNCTACSSSQQLKAGECQDLNHTQSNSEHENEECADSCLTCLKRRPDDCLTCSPGFVLAGPAPSACQCPPNTVLSSSTRSCQPCPSLCSACDQPNDCSTWHYRWHCCL